MAQAEFEAEIAQLQEKHAGADWKSPEKLDEIARDFRNCATKHSQAGTLKGFNLEINGVDCSKRRHTGWPQHVFDAPDITVKLTHFGKDYVEPIALVPKLAKALIKQEPGKQKEAWQAAG